MYDTTWDLSHTIQNNLTTVKDYASVGSPSPVMREDFAGNKLSYRLEGDPETYSDVVFMDYYKFYYGVTNADTATITAKVYWYVYNGRNDGDVLDTAAQYSTPINLYTYAVNGGEQSVAIYYNDKGFMSDYIVFNPYVRMTIQDAEMADHTTLDISLDTKRTRDKEAQGVKDVYVFSDIMRAAQAHGSMYLYWTNRTPTDAASKYGTMQIRSDQWSVHNKATVYDEIDKSTLGWRGVNQVLPGGAIFQLDTDGNSNGVQAATSHGGTKIQMRTFNVVYDLNAHVKSMYDAARAESKYGEAVAAPSDKMSIANIKARAEKFYNDIMNTTKGLHVVQYMNPQWDITLDNLLAQTNIFKPGDNGTSTDAKYYLRQYVAGNEASKEDCLTNQSSLIDYVGHAPIYVYYVLYSDVEGNVWAGEATESGQLIEGTQRKILTREQTLADVNWNTVVSKTTIDGSATTLAELEAGTGVVSSFIGSINRNSGDDDTAYWAHDNGHWYNEAQDAIYVVQSYAYIELGFDVGGTIGASATGQRQAASDPSLEPERTGQSDLFSSAHAAAWATEDQVITSKGDDYELKLPNVNKLYYTRKYYIPNVSVTDLS